MSFTGNSLEQTLALLTGGGEITQDIASLGNALKVVSLRLQNQAGKLQEIGEDYEDIESVSKMQTQMYNLTHGKVNIMQADDPNAFKSTYEILEEVAAVIKDLNDTEASELVQLMFGKSRANQGMALLQAFQSGQIQKAFEAASDAEGSAMTEHERWLDSLDAKLAQLKAAGQSFSLEFLDTNAVKNATDGLTGILNLLTKIADNFGSLSIISAGVLSSFTIMKNAGVFSVVDGDAKGFSNKFGFLGQSFNTLGTNYRTNVMNIDSGRFRHLRAIGGSFMDSYVRAGISDADSAALRNYATEITKTDDLQAAFNATMTDTSKVAQKQVAVINDLNAQRKVDILSQDMYTARVNAATQATNSLSLAQKAMAVAGKVAATALNLAFNIGLVAIITFITNKIAAAINYTKEVAERAKEAGQAAKETTKTISELHTEYVSLNDAVDNGTASKEDLTAKTNDLLEALGLEGIAVSELVDKYGSLDNAINTLSLDALKQAHGDLVGSIKAYEETLLKTGKNSFTSSNAFSLFDNTAGTPQKNSSEYQKLLDIFKKYNNIETQVINKNGSNVGWLFNLQGDTDTIEGIVKNYETLESIQQDFISSFGSDRASDFDIFTRISDRLKILRTDYENYINEIDALNNNAAQQAIINSLKGGELPKTQEEYETFFNTLVANATKANSEMRNQFIGSDDEIKAAIEAALRNMDAFKDFTFDSVPVTISVLPTVTVDVEGLEAKIKTAKEQIASTIKNADLFDTAYDTIKSGGSISFDDVLTMVNLDSSLAGKFEKTATGYTIAAEELTDAKKNYIKATKDALNLTITESRGAITEATNHIADMEDRLNELNSNKNYNSGYDYQKAQSEIADLTDTIAVEKQNIEDANGVINESNLLLGELSATSTSVLAPSLSTVENQVKLTQTAMEEMRDEGQISASTYNDIVAMGSKYSECLEIQNGKLVINTEKLKELQQQEIKNEIAETRLAKASWETVMATHAMAGEDTSAIAEKIRELTNQEAALNNAYDEITNAKPEDKKESEGEDEWKKQFDTENTRWQYLVATHQKTQTEYIEWLRDANKKYFSDLTKYSSEYYQNEQTIFENEQENLEKNHTLALENIAAETEAIDKQLERTLDEKELIKQKREELSAFNKEMQEEFGLGNVDLTVRPKVEMEDGSRATVLSGLEFLWQGDEENGKYVAVHYTPILPDGTILDDDTLGDYLENALQGADDILKADTMGLVLKVDTDLNITEDDIASLASENLTDHMKEVIQACDDWDVKLHEVQEEWMELTDVIDNSLSRPDATFDEKIAAVDAAYSREIELANQAIGEIDRRIKEIQDSGLVGYEDELRELEKTRQTYLDNIYDAELNHAKKIQELYSDEVDKEISYWENLKSNDETIYDNQIDKLNKVKEALEKRNEEEEKAADLAEKQLALEKAKLELEKARQNRSVMLVTKQGTFYTADSSAIQEAEENVKEAEKDIADAKKEDEVSKIEDAITALENDKDIRSKYYETIINLLEKATGDTAPDASNPEIWNHALSTEEGQKAIANMDKDTLSYLLANGVLKSDGKTYTFGGVSTLYKNDNPDSSEIVDDVHGATISVKDAMTNLNNVMESLGASATTITSESQTSLIGQAAINRGQEIQQSITYKVQNMTNTYHIDKIDVGYSGNDFEGLLKTTLDTITNGIIVNGNKVVFGR